MKSYSSSQRNWHCSDTYSCYFSSSGFLYNFQILNYPLCVIFLSLCCCHLFFNQPIGFRYPTEVSYCNVVALFLWWPWRRRHKPAHFPLFWALKLLTLAVQQCVFCLANAVKPRQQWSIIGKNLSLCFFQLCCEFAGAAKVCFWWPVLPAPCPVGVVSPGYLIVPCCIFHSVCAFFSHASSPLHLLPSVLRVFLPSQPCSPLLFSSASPEPVSVPSRKGHQPCPLGTHSPALMFSFASFLSPPSLLRQDLSFLTPESVSREKPDSRQNSH